ncbi:MAG: substrate-binding domain-containing protein [Archangiaceae bacterium]|nr:substrate-binding domain-containing protein [Archangiaceae bacterium]
MMRRSMGHRALAVVLMMWASGCTKSEKKLKVALLLPEAKTARYESQDRPHFEAKLKALCAECEVIYGNAAQDASKQQAQAEAALTNGARVVVLDPVDGTAARSIAEKAKAGGATVIAYDRLILGTEAVDAYVAFEAENIGRFQAQALLEAIGGKGNVIVINGAPTDPNAALLKKGMHAVLDGKVKIVREYDTPDWSPDKAQEEMTQALTALGAEPLDGVYCANDGTAGGAIAAMKAAGVKLLPVTGQDAELAALQRVLTGEQHSTIYKALKLEAETAAALAVAALKGEALKTDAVADNGKKKVPAIVLAPVAVTKANVGATVLKDGFWKREQLCSGEYEQACKDAGL